MTSSIKLQNPHPATHLPTHEHAARKRRAQDAALRVIPGTRPPKSQVHKGRKTLANHSGALPPLGYGHTPL